MRSRSLTRRRTAALVLAGLLGSLLGVAASPAAAGPVSDVASPRAPVAQATSGRAAYPWHTRIVATTFWVGEIFDPDAPDGSQMISTYDDDWYASYGGCDGRVQRGVCRTERRFTRDGWFPRHMTPKQNPFYLDVPYDDLNDKVGFRRRGEVVPWASRPRYADLVDDRDVSLMKNRWVQIRSRGRTCYGQVQDAGPGKYHDARYVFGRRDARPASKRYNNAGMDVSPALNGCLRFRSLNGQRDRVAWRFVDARDVPRGPWKRIVTR